MPAVYRTYYCCFDTFEPIAETAYLDNNNMQMYDNHNYCCRTGHGPIVSLPFFFNFFFFYIVHGGSYASYHRDWTNVAQKSSRVWRCVSIVHTRRAHRRRHEKLLLHVSMCTIYTLYSFRYRLGNACTHHVTVITVMVAKSGYFSTDGGWGIWGEDGGDGCARKPRFRRVSTFITV